MYKQSDLLNPCLLRVYLARRNDTFLLPDSIHGLSREIVTDGADGPRVCVCADIELDVKHARKPGKCLYGSRHILLSGLSVHWWPLELRAAITYRPTTPSMYHRFHCPPPPPIILLGGGTPSIIIRPSPNTTPIFPAKKSMNHVPLDLHAR